VCSRRIETHNDEENKNNKKKNKGRKSQ